MGALSQVKVVCSASCYQLASESLVKVIASEPCSEPPMLWVTDCVEARYACEKQVQNNSPCENYPIDHLHAFVKEFDLSIYHFYSFA